MSKVKLAYLSSEKHDSMSEEDVREWLRTTGFDLGRTIDITVSWDMAGGVPHAASVVRFQQQL